jgi:hypothetical protein
VSPQIEWRVTGAARYETLMQYRHGALRLESAVKHLRLFQTIVMAAAALAVMPSVARAEARAVIELFTSQGCSSCPAADKLMGELAKDPSVVVISVPIDYWDYLGWKDTLAKPRHTARQRGYSAVRGDREVYTPQAVINGSAHALGSDRAAIDSVIKKTRQNDSILSVPVRLSLSNEKLDVSLDAAKHPANAEVWLCSISKAVPVTIGRGENRGHTVTYHNVVRQWTRLGAWNGTAQTFSVPRSELRRDGVDTIAVLVQGGTIESPGAMLGAAVKPLD